MTQHELETGEFNFIMLLCAIAIITLAIIIACEEYKRIKYYYKLGKQIADKPRKVPSVLREEWEK